MKPTAAHAQPSKKTLKEQRGKQRHAQGVGRLAFHGGGDPGWLPVVVMPRRLQAPAILGESGSAHHVAPSPKVLLMQVEPDRALGLLAIPSALVLSVGILLQESRVTRRFTRSSTKQFTRSSTKQFTPWEQHLSALRSGGHVYVCIFLSILAWIFKEGCSTGTDPDAGLAFSEVF
ncbi:hypothetical protein ACP70R_031012 [Stipagrostis hirtigluma subsp. patula]